MENWVDQAPVLEYQFYLFKTGQFNVLCYLVPTFPLVAGRGLRHAVGLDDESPHLVTVDAGLAVPSKTWQQNVLDETTTGSTTLNVAAGPHVLKIYMVDPGVVLDKIVMDAGGVRPSYLGPVETKVSASSPVMKR
jgi:hypothetical protein